MMKLLISEHPTSCITQLIPCCSIWRVFTLGVQGFNPQSDPSWRQQEVCHGELRTRSFLWLITGDIWWCHCWLINVNKVDNENGWLKGVLHGILVYIWLLCKIWLPRTGLTQPLRPDNTFGLAQRRCDPGPPERKVKPNQPMSERLMVHSHVC